MLYIQSGKDGCFIMHTCRWFWKVNIVAAAMEYFGIESPDDQPSTAIEILKKEGDKQAKFQEMVLDMVRKV